MKKDWSVFRITVLLYVIALLLPLNYYFANRSFQSMQSDGSTMKQLVYINGGIQRILTLSDSTIERDMLIKEVEASFRAIDEAFLQAPANAEYVALFRADEGFDATKDAWKKLADAVEKRDPEQVYGDQCWKEVNSFSKIIEEMLAYKSESMLDSLYLSLIFTTLLVIVLIFMIRFYIHVQIRKHTVHDHITGLYNKKYFYEVMEKSKLLAARQKNELSLLALSFDDFEVFKKSLKKREFERFLQEFGKEFQGLFRQSDTVCRIEANRFLVILPDASLEDAQKFAGRLEERLQNHSFSLGKSISLQIGVASYRKESGVSLLEEATEVMKRSRVFVIGGIL